MTKPETVFRAQTPAPPSRFARYFTTTGWVHVLLLLFAWLFFFPLLWMAATSFKTDEEIPDGALLPAIPFFHPDSPYVRDAIPTQRPADVTPERWTELLPTLTDHATSHILAIQHATPKLDLLAPIDESAHRASATAILLNNAVAQLNKDLWTTSNASLLSAYDALLTPEAITSTLRSSLASIDLLAFQLHTLDAHLYTLTPSSDFATTWQVESGPARLVPTPAGTLLSYHFTDSAPNVQRHAFPFPVGVSSADLHKLIFAIQSDNSWHRIDARLDLPDGSRLSSTRTTYLAQFRPMSLLFQPPTFDDQILRAKDWIPLRSNSALRNPPSDMATLRLIIHPSSTPRAIWGKIIRNYLRAFDAIPFWRYLANSSILVALTTLGSLFSASFVAYAFARLHWPGRSTAFLLLLATMMLPPQVTMIPGFLIWRGLHWYNTLNPLWVPSFFGTAFFIFLMTQHMRTIPKELEEAARLDGLSPLQSWYYIILPNIKPVLAAIAILSFMSSWNEFLQPLIYIRDQAKFPLALGLYGLKVDQLNPLAPDWSLILAGDVLMTLPVLAVFFLFQRYFVQGLTMTGMKG